MVSLIFFGCPQVSDSKSLAGPSTQLSMAQPDLLLELQLLDSDARLSIFDDAISTHDVSQAGVVSKVATAVKGWQKYRSAAGKCQQDSVTATTDATGEESVQDDTASTDTSPTAAPYSSLSDAEATAQEQPSLAVVDGVQIAQPDALAVPADSLAAVCADAIAHTPGPTSDSTTSVMIPESGSMASSSAAPRKVGFAEPSSEDPAESAGASSGDGSQRAEVDGRQKAEGDRQTEQQATAADLRARVAAAMRRCA